MSEPRLHNTVVVGYDGSESSQTAVEWAANEALARDAELLLLAAITVPMSASPMSFGVVSPGSIDDMLARVAEHATKAAEAAAAAHPGLVAHARSVLGGASAALVEASESADVVVVGSRGMGGFKGLLVGSVGVQVAEHAKCPAVVIRREAASTADRVVVGIDGSPLSLAAADFAMQTASRRGWSVLAVHSWDIPTYDTLSSPIGPSQVEIDNLIEGERVATSESLAGLRERYPDVALEVEVAKGPPARILLEAAEGAALLVLGTRGRGEFTGALLGSTSQSVLHRAEVPVAVVGGQT